jgi:hypothetical protein
VDRSRWIALIAIVVYLVVFILPLLSDSDGGRHAMDRRQFLAQYAGGLMVLLGFACLWWSETLGDGLWAGRGAWNPKPSSEVAIKLLGYVFLVAAFALHVIVRTH